MMMIFIYEKNVAQYTYGSSGARIKFAPIELSLDLVHPYLVRPLGGTLCSRRNLLHASLQLICDYLCLIEAVASSTCISHIQDQAPISGLYHPKKSSELSEMDLSYWFED